MGFWYKCSKCKDAGVIETGNNDLPCSCRSGDRSEFNVAGVRGSVTGAEVKQHFLNNSPDPIEPKGGIYIHASTLPGRQDQD